MSRLIRNPHYALIALTVIIFSAWLVLKTDKSSSDSDISDQGAGRHTISQVSEHPSTTESNNPSGRKNVLKSSVQAQEMVKTKTDDTHDRTQPVATTGEPPANVAKQANKVKAPHARPAISNPKALRRFGKGAPFVIGDLPDGKLKEDLLALTPNHKAKALKWLHSFNFSGIDAIESLRADNTGGIFYTCRGADVHGKACAHHAHHAHTATASTESAITAEVIVEETSELTAPVVAAAAVSVSSPPVYNSKPDAPNHIYLDFNGGVVTGKAWNNNPNHGNVVSWDVQVWSQDGDFTTFNDSEQAWMRRVYERVAEDYAPFNVNVTTDAATYDPDNTGGLNNVGWLLHCTGTDKNGVDLPHAGSGGVAYVGVFGAGDFASTYQPAWVSSTNGGGNEADVAEASSHEMGHNMGLSHDTRSDEAYYGGHGSGDTSWGPIMGTGYGQNVTQWSKGEYFDSKHASWNGSSYDNHENTNDDLAIISARVPYRVDDHGDSTGAATEITPLGDGSINQTGIIETTDDPDVFQFSTGAGTITLNANPYKCDTDTFGGNLDIIMELYDGGSNLIASNNPTANTYASISTTVVAGNYYLIVKPTGVGDPLISPPTGYTVYGSVGQYTITGNVILPSVNVTEAGGTTVIEGGATDTYSLVLGTPPSSNVTVTITPSSQVTVDQSSVTFTTSNWSAPQTVTVTAVDDSTEEGSHIGTISHVASSSDSAFNGVGVGSVIANIIDNDNIVVTSPNGGERWFTNTTKTIEWDSLLGGNVKIELLKGVSLDPSLIVESTPNDGSYDWSVPLSLLPAGDYKIRITSDGSPSKTDTSDSDFTFVEGPIYFTDLEADPGFTKTGDWAWGTPSGNNYASSAYSGSKMYDTHLSGTAYNTSVLTSTAIDCSLYTGITLEFWSHIVLYDPDFTAKFEVSNDNSTWNTLFEQTGLAETSWIKYMYDISTYANGQPTVYVRWSMVRNGSSVTQWTGGGIALDDIKLTGTYTSPVTTYSVTYLGNGNTGGSVPTDASTYEELATVTVLGNTGNLVKTGYAFSGWNTQTDGGGVSYSPAATFPMGASDVTLYAQWTELPPYITSDSPGYFTPTTAPLTQITVNFNKAMDPTSFSTGADILSFTGPSGIDLSSAIAVATATWIDTQTLTIDFSLQPQSTEGFYRLVLRPNIADLAGNFIDQDQDTFIAEPLEDSYSAYALIGESVGSESTFWSDLVGADNTAAAWVFAGTDSSWETGLPKETPTAGPSAAFDGNTIIAQNLAGNYNIDEVSTATTPTIDASAYTGVSLAFQGWKEAGKNDTLYIDASSDNGSNWQRVYTYTAPNGGTSDGAWTPYTVDLSAYDNSSTLKLRWGLIDGTTGNSGEHTGWQIDAIEVKGTSAATPAPAPKVMAHSPTGEIIATASSIWLEFSQPMDTASGFPLAGIKSFTGPSGATAITATGSSWVNESMLRIDFPTQSATGSYSLVLDSQIQDVKGIALDQNANGTAGETVDTYDAAFSIGSLPVDHFVISPITGSPTVGAPITGITITAKDSSNETVLDFTGTITFAGTAGITGTSGSFVDGVLSNVSLIPTVVGNDLTLTVDDGSFHTGSATFTVLSKFQSWADGNTTFSADTNNDGVSDGLAWLLGSSEPGANAQSLTPAGNSNSGGDLIMTFNYLNAANRGSAVMSVQHSHDMGVTDLWANHTVVIPESSGTVNGVIFIITPNGNFNEVQATVPAGAPDSPVFGRILGDAPTP